MAVIDIQHLSLQTGKTEILHDVSFSVEKGQIHALIGENGAGKTSLLRILLGLTLRYQGTVLINGSDALEMQRRNIGSVMDEIVPNPKVTGRKYLHQICDMLGGCSNADEQTLLHTVGLKSEGSKLIGKYSLGMKKRLMIACALAGKPDILILDEPFNGIDANGMNEMRLLMQQLKKEGITILITSHIIPELLKVSDQYSILSCGTLTDSLSYEALSGLCIPKVRCKPQDTAAFTEQFRRQYPETEIIASAGDTVSVFNMTKAQFQNAMQSVQEQHILSAEQETMSEEEILLWKMHGKGT